MKHREFMDDIKLNSVETIDWLFSHGFITEELCIQIYNYMEEEME